MADYPSFQISTGQIIQQEIISQNSAQQTRWRKDSSKFVRSILSRTKHSQALLNGRAMKTGFRAVSSHAVLITCEAVILTRKTPNKGPPGKNKISNFSNKLSIRHASSSRRELSNTHVISCHMMWITCLLVSSFLEGSSSLIEARDGSLESASKTLSIRLHLYLECTVPLTAAKYHHHHTFIG